MKKILLSLVIILLSTTILTGCESNSNEAFFEIMEVSITERMDTTSTENYDRATVVNAELVHMDKIAQLELKDERIKEIYDMYVEGLNIQKESLKAEKEYAYQIEWQRGLVKRYEALNALYSEYEFLKDNEKFIASYISGYDDQVELLNAYDAIEADIGSQKDNFSEPDDYKYYDSGAELTFTLKNNTQYIFSTVFEFDFITEDNKLFYSNSAIIEDIKPGQSYSVTVYVDFTNCDTEYVNWEWENYYTDVKY